MGSPWKVKPERCKHGHLFTPENTHWYQRPNRGTPERRCLECRNRWSRASYSGIRRKTHCKRGHEYTEENTYLKSNGARICRECRVVWSEKYLQRVGITERRRALHNANVAKRKAQKLRATPSWANLEAIQAIYSEAQRLTETTGVRHHVDHIYPLQGKEVCGLHVEGNLQILTARENVKKYNRLITPKEEGSE